MSAATPKAPDRQRARGNPFGLSEALLGLIAGFVLSIVFVTLFANLSGHPRHPSSYGTDLCSLAGLWLGFFSAAALAGRHGEPSLWRRLRDNYGLCFRPIDVPLGLGIGVASQFVLAPLLELPLYPFVKNLSHRLGAPARQLTSGVHGPGLVLLGLLICVGSPFFEELFFRGLVLRGLLGRFGNLGPRLGPTISIVITGVVFGLVHFEPLQLSALIGFGIVLSVLAYRTGRLGPGMVAHSAFNLVTFLALVSLR